MSREMTSEEAEVIEQAMDWAQARYARDHLGQPTEQMAADALERLMSACSDLLAGCDGEPWRRPRDV